MLSVQCKSATKWRTIGTLLVLSLGAASCRHVPVEVAAPRPQAADVAQAPRLASGRAIYVAADKCASCHRPKPVYEYSAFVWSEKIMPRMGKKAKLTQTEYDDVLAYVTSPAGQSPPPAAMNVSDIPQPVR